MVCHSHTERTKNSVNVLRSLKLPIESQVNRLGFFGLWQLFYIILLNTASTFLPYSAVLGSANGGCGGSTPSCLHKFKESNATDVFDTLPPANITAIPVFVAFLPVASHKLSLMCASKRPFYCHLIIASANFIYCQLEIRKGCTPRSNSLLLLRNHI